MQIKELQIIYPQFVLLTENMVQQSLNMREISFFWLVPYWFIQIQKIINHLTVVHMIRYSTKAVILWDICQIIFTIILTKCFIVPDYTLFYVTTIQTRLVHYLV